MNKIYLTFTLILANIRHQVYAAYAYSKILMVSLQSSDFKHFFQHLHKVYGSTSYFIFFKMED